MKLPEFSEYFSGEARKHLLKLLEVAVEEDGPDLTSDGIFSPSDTVTAEIIAKEATIVAGLPVIPIIMDLCAVMPDDLGYTWQALASEGERVAAGTLAARISGSARRVLKAERIILNFISRVSGIARLTSEYVHALEGTGTRLLDTRKTAPGLRYPDKYGVLCGGGTNHRRNLVEMLMIKDNHIDAAGSISAAVAKLRSVYEKCPPIEVECRNADEVREAVACAVDRIMLDNMHPEDLQTMLALIPAKIETEVSGGVTLETIRTFASSAATRRLDFISVGRITNSAAVSDFSMRISQDFSNRRNPQ
ncbi:MAG: carboxylating nicotinate-nucleotide diphosphorylase [Desulfovibrionaceae bacterium]|nr:carboxylating nicotinate-nucleotide diphosphorylase [Desulfovibrionaceae bacterium]